MIAPHVTVNPDGGLTVVYSPEQRRVVESRDRSSQAVLCDKLAEQVFVAECVSLTKPAAVA